MSQVTNASNIIASLPASVEVANDSGNPLPISATTAANSASNPLAAQLSDGSAAYTAAKTGQLPSALVSGRLDVNIGASAATVSTAETRPATATLTNVASSASSVSLLASNANARLRTVYNDSTANLFLKFGTTASATSFTVKIPASGYYEFPQPLYTGAVDGIWDAANGNARLTEVA